jgi:hypothetical protein
VFRLDFGKVLVLQALLEAAQHCGDGGWSSRRARRGYAPRAHLLAAAVTPLLVADSDLSALYGRGGRAWFTV